MSTRVHRGARVFRLAGVATAILGLSLAVSTPPSFAQAVTGTIFGTVRDSSGAVVKDAAVTLTHTQTGTVRSVVADGRGEYTAPLISTGTYEIVCQMAGFKAVTLTGVRVGVDQKVRADLNLEVGQLTDSVSIQAESPVVQTGTSDLSATINETQIQSLPLNVRNFVPLARTIPGVSRGGAGDNIDGSTGAYGWRASASFSANGQRTRDNNFMLDGVDNNELWLNTVVVFPDIDALEEFKVQTSTYSAEFGRSLGGVVNLQTKSGTNTLHGSAWEFLRDEKLDSNDWYANKTSTARQPLSRHQFGGTLSGPIWKNKTQFFVDYQGMRLNQGMVMISTVPSAKMRTGDFSELNKPIYDPLTPGTPFPNNTIPAAGGPGCGVTHSCQDPAAVNIMNKLYPTATPGQGTLATDGSGWTVNNYIRTPAQERQDNQFDVKINHQFASNNQAFVRYSWGKNHRFMPGSLEHGDQGANVAQAMGGGAAGIGDIKAQSLAFNDVHSFSGNLINEFRVGWSSIEINSLPIDYGQNLASAMGIPGINFQAKIDPNTGRYTTEDKTVPMPYASAPAGINFGGDVRNLGPTGSQPLFSNSRVFHILDSITYVKGRNTFKAGGEVLFLRRDVLNAASATGLAGFSYTMTSNCAGIPSGCTPNSKTGTGLASFMLGYPSSWDRSQYEKPYTETRPHYGAYILDDIRVSRSFTLNLGLRWDLFVPYVTEGDRQSNFDLTTGKFVIAGPDATMHPTSNVMDYRTNQASTTTVNVGPYLQTYSKTDFAPRLGFAWDVLGKGKTVIRGGYGKFWNSPMTGTSSSKAQNPPFLLTQNPTATFVPNAKLSQGLGLLPAAYSGAGTVSATGNTRSVTNVDFRDGYAWQRSIGIQQQIFKNYVVEIGYIGSQGRQLVVRKNINQAPVKLGVTDPNVNRPFATLAPGLTDIAMSVPEGTLDFNALLVRFNRRFANGFSFSNSYTYGQAIDLDSSTDGNTSFTDSYNPNYNRGPASYDIKHSITSTLVYELPIAREKWFGGWHVSGVVFWRTGYPFTVTQTQSILSTGMGGTGIAYGPRPDRIGDGTLDNPTIDKWFDTSAFTMPTEKTATYGTAGKNILRGPGQFTVDMALLKVTKISGLTTELRVEAFNLFNNPAFSNPNATIGNAQVGTIGALLPLTPQRQIQLGLKVRF